MKMQNVLLNNGIEMPILGLGVYKIEEPTVCIRCIHEAIDAGYRLFDTAKLYNNESAVGQAIKTCNIPREELFITTKVWINEAGYEKTKRSFYATLKLMQLEYLDLYLIHQPFGDTYGAWRAMEELYKDGLIRAIGVSNFLPDRLVDFILHNHTIPAVNQVETHPFYQQIESQAIMKEYNVQMQSWAPFAKGKGEMFQNKTLTAIAENHNKSVAQVILRWLIQRGIVIIPKSSNKERIVENINIFDFSLNNDEMLEISTLDSKETLFYPYRDPNTVKRMSDIAPSS